MDDLERTPDSRGHDDTDEPRARTAGDARPVSPEPVRARVSDRGSGCPPLGNGFFIMLSSLHERHVLKLRALAVLLKQVHPELAAWLDQAITWEECRRAGLRIPFVPLDRVLSRHQALYGAFTLRKLRGRLVDTVQVRLLVCAIAEELLEMAATRPR